MREDFWVGGDVSIRWWVIDGQPGHYMATMVDRGHLYNNQQRFGARERGLCCYTTLQCVDYTHLKADIVMMIDNTCYMES